MDDHHEGGQEKDLVWFWFVCRIGDGRCGEDHAADTVVDGWRASDLAKPIGPSCDLDEGSVTPTEGAELLQVGNLREI